MSFQALAVNVTSRGAAGLVSHSGAYSEQNSSQPIGARMLPPTEMNGGRSLRAFVGDAAMAAAIAATAIPVANFLVGHHFICVAPCLFSRGHISHKQFERQ